jgi:hypothetical protein
MAADQSSRLPAVNAGWYGQLCCHVVADHGSCFLSHQAWEIQQPPENRNRHNGHNILNVNCFLTLIAHLLSRHALHNSHVTTRLRKLYGDEGGS